MRRTYTYDNAVIHITIPDGAIKNIHKATKHFLHKIVKERNQNDNTDQSRDITKK